MAGETLEAKVVRFEGNEQRFNTLVNGGPDDTWSSTGGTELPSVQKFFADTEALYDNAVLVASYAEMESRLPTIPEGSVVEVQKDETHGDSRTRYNVQSGVATFLVNIDRWVEVVKRAPLTYPDYAAASAAAATLPDGQSVEIEEDETHDGRRTRYFVQSGALDFRVYADLTGQEGSGKVGYHAGTGAVDQTAESKLNRFIEINEFTTTERAVAAAIERGAPLRVTSAITVNIPGDFPTLQAAIEYLTVERKGIFVTLNIQSGHVIQSQLLLDGVDARNFKIVSEDPVVTINRASLTMPWIDRYPAFGADKNTVMPAFHAMFTMDDSGPSMYRDAFFIYGNSHLYMHYGSGCTNAGHRGLHVSNNSTVQARLVNFDGAGGRGLRVANGSYACVRNSSFKNAQAQNGDNGEGIAISAAIVSAMGCDVSGSAIGIHCYSSNLMFEDGIADDCGSGLQIWGSQFDGRRASVQRSTEIAVEAREGAIVGLRNANLSDAGSHGIYASGATVEAPDSTILRSGGSAVTCVGSKVGVGRADLQNAAQYGVYAQNGSIVDADGANALGAGISGFYNINGSFINAHSTQGTKGRATNTFSRHGAIFNES